MRPPVRMAPDTRSAVSGWDCAAQLSAIASDPLVPVHHHKVAAMATTIASVTTTKPTPARNAFLSQRCGGFTGFFSSTGDSAGCFWGSFGAFIRKQSPRSRASALA